MLEQKHRSQECFDEYGTGLHGYFGKKRIFQVMENYYKYEEIVTDLGIIFVDLSDLLSVTYTKDNSNEGCRKRIGKICILAVKRTVY